VLSLRRKRREIPYDARILGSGDFVQILLQEEEEELARRMRHRAPTNSVVAAIGEIRKTGGVNEQELLRGGRRRKVSQVRPRSRVIWVEKWDSPWPRSLGGWAWGPQGLPWPCEGKRKRGE
jgi:hypothetical protein